MNDVLVPAAASCWIASACRVGGPRCRCCRPRVLRQALVHLQQTFVLRRVRKGLAPRHSEPERIAHRGRTRSARCAQRLGQCAPFQLHPVAPVHRIQVVVLTVANLEAELRLHAVEQLMHHEPAARMRVGRNHLPHQCAPASAAPIHRCIGEAQCGRLLRVRRRLAGGNRVGRRVCDDHRPAQRYAPQLAVLVFAKRGSLLEINRRPCGSTCATAADALQSNTAAHRQPVLFKP